MAEYTEKEALIAHIKNLPTCWADAGGVYGRSMKYPEGMFDCEDVVSSIENAPAADVAPVVRCKYCGNFRQNGYGACWCNEYGGTITPEGYCSRAVLRTNATTPQRAIAWEAD